MGTEAKCPKGPLSTCVLVAGATTLLSKPLLGNQGAAGRSPPPNPHAVLRIPGMSTWLSGPSVSGSKQPLGQSGVRWPRGPSPRKPTRTHPCSRRAPAWHPRPRLSPSPPQTQPPLQPSLGPPQAAVTQGPIPARDRMCVQSAWEGGAGRAGKWLLLVAPHVPGCGTANATGAGGQGQTPDWQKRWPASQGPQDLHLPAPRLQPESTTHPRRTLS